jgi:AAT family amino acid transporter
MPQYRWSNPLTIAFFLAIFASLFFNQSSILPAVGALVWALGFNVLLAYRQRKLDVADSQDSL